MYMYRTKRNYRKNIFNLCAKHYNNQNKFIYCDKILKICYLIDANKLIILKIKSYVIVILSTQKKKS